jgi:hypothetical protein
MLDHIPIFIMGNNTSRLPPYPLPPSYLDLGSLLALAPNEKAWVLAAIGTNPLNKAKTILQNPAIGRPGLLLSTQELSLAVDNVYSNFRSGRMVNESYIINLLDAIVDRIRRDREGMVEGIEQVVMLAARMVKGEACEECYMSDYQSPTHGSVELARRFVDTIEDLDGLATDHGVELLLSSRTRYSIDKLCSIYEYFDWVRHLGGYAGDADDLEEMWCHGKSRCGADCWDSGYDNLHLKWCRPSE